MKAFLDDRQRAHAPQSALQLGMMRPSREQPERVARLQAGAEAAGCVFEAPADAGLGPIAALHAPEYLTFLETIHARWIRTEGASDEVIPNIHPDRRTVSYPRSATGQSGFHQADTSCPIAAGTWQSAYWSAQSALSAVDIVLAGEPAAYALCRPPGHHAFGDHADPARFYPFFWGHAQERGEDEGMGYNLNLPLPRGTGDEDYLAALGLALARIRSFGADTLVVALGLDAHENDPFHGFKVTTAGFARIAGAIAGMDLPTVIVQEGGYLSSDLGDNLTSFLNGYEAG